MLWVNMTYICGHSQRCIYVDPIRLAHSLCDYKGIPKDWDWLVQTLVVMSVTYMFLTAYLLTNCILIALTALFMQDTFFLLLRIVSIAEIKFTCIYTHILPQCIVSLQRDLIFCISA